MGNASTNQDALLAIARAVRDSQGYDEWNARFQDPVLREVYRLAAV